MDGPHLLGHTNMLLAMTTSKNMILNILNEILWLNLRQFAEPRVQGTNTTNHFEICPPPARPCAFSQIFGQLKSMFFYVSQTRGPE